MAQDIKKGRLSLPEKLQRLEMLYANAQSKKPQPKQRLFLLLWEQDIKDLKAIRVALLSEQTNILVENLDQKRQFSPLETVVITIGQLKEKNKLYNRSLLKSNISRLLEAHKMLKQINTPEEQLVLDCTVKINFMLAILQMWQAFEDQSAEFDSYAFASTILSIKAYVLAEFLSEEDIKKIQELIKNPMFTNFIENGFYKLDRKSQKDVLDACKKIREKKGLENFPMPVKQEQQSLQPEVLLASELEPIAEKQVAPVSTETPEEKQQRLVGSQSTTNEHIRLAAQEEQRLQEREERRQIVVPAPPVRQPADNNQPQDFWTRVSIAFNGFINTISQGFSRIWRSLFGG